ncbi:MAG: ABC transporter permease [Chloroflexi bacterium]|nr:ABC transporter permease [Chloroflexota bacterium]MBV9544590.1 ABC transporter permease [Chloroflexota bacterium]
MLLALISLFAPVIAPHDPNQTNLINQFDPPSASSLFGTDELGRDLFSRVLYGGQTALLTALGAVALASIVGIPLGLISGYFGRWADAVIMRVVDVLLAIPAILIALGLIAMFGRGTVNVIVAVGIVNIPAFARLTRATTLLVKEHDYVQATQAMGAGYAYLLARTILPNAIGPILVQMAVTGATAILLASALSFLGLGIQPPTSDWGTMLSIGRQHLFEAPWYGIFPGLAIAVTVYALDELSKALQDLLGARTRAELSL